MRTFTFAAVLTLIASTSGAVADAHMTSVLTTELEGMEGMEANIVLSRWLGLFVAPGQ